MSNNSYIVTVECPHCGIVREVRVSTLQYPRIKRCQSCARTKITAEGKHVVIFTKRPSPTWESDPFATGQLPASVTANALWI